MTTEGSVVLKPKWPIIGFTGKAGCGKDTAANLIRMFCRPVHRVAFADPMKAMLSEGFGFTQSQWSDRAWKESKIDEVMPSPRRLAQTLGTDWGRNMIHPDIWVRLAALNIANHGAAEHTVITDVRFENEAAWINSCGGVVVEITRQYVPMVAAHISEAGIRPEQIHVSIPNDESISALWVRLCANLVSSTEVV